MNRFSILINLFNCLEERGLFYCHWKSNDHVAEGMCGITDLDILVDGKQYLELQEVLAICGFKRGVSGFSTSLPGVEGYLGFDTKTGLLAYIHMHYQIVLGRSRLKEYSLRWNEKILNTRIFDKEMGLFVIDPNLEMLLLFVRAALKIRLRDKFYQFVGKTYFGQSWIKQYVWLKDYTEKEKSIELCRELLGDDVASEYSKILDKYFGLRQLQSFKRKVIIQLSLNNAYGPIIGNLIMWGKEIIGIIAYINRKYLDYRLPVTRKILSSGGAFIVLIGPDGSGKSTLSKKLVGLLSWKLDVLHVYLGAGDGSSSRLRSVMRWFQSFFEKHGILIPKSKARDCEEKSLGNLNATAKRGFFYWFAKICWALVLSNEKSSKLKIAWRARNQGKVVIADRYPQTQIEGFNDGPLLGKWLQSKNVLMRKIASWERKPYSLAHENPPDLVVRLNVSPETALKRDPEMETNYIKKRIHAVNSFSYPLSTRLVEINANDSIENVFLEVSREVWKIL